jgi:hypothetical protein
MRIAGLLSVFATGCVVGIGGGTGGSGNAPPEDPNPTGIDGDSIPTNGLIFDPDVAAMLQPVALATSVGADGSVVLTSNASVAAVPSGQMLLKYIAICALPKEHTLVVGADRFPGFYGLATAWETAACDETCEHWMSGCVLAHANRNGTHVSLSLRGDHPNLPTAIRPGFTSQEAAFYGDLFTGELYACMGANATDDAGERAVLGRICDLGQCGLVNAGQCSLPVDNGQNWGACEQTTGDHFADCHHTAAFGDTQPAFHEAITVYLEP